MVEEYECLMLAESCFLSSFQYLGLIIIVTGSVFNVIFHVGVKEPTSDALRVWLEERKNGKLKSNKFKRKGSESNGD